MSKPFDVLAAMEELGIAKIEVCWDTATTARIGTFDRTDHEQAKVITTFGLYELRLADDQHKHIMDRLRPCEPPIPPLALTLNGVEIALTPEQNAQFAEALRKPTGRYGNMISIMPEMGECTYGQ